MRTGRVSRKRGFTLVETIVTVGIVATLAAVVVPEVVKQFDTSEPTRTQQDLKNLATAIQTFNVNVKALPGDIADLTTQITADAGGLPSPDTSITGTGGLASFSTAQAGYWNGPYIDAPLVEATTEATRETGQGGTIHDDFVCYNATDNLEASTGTATNQACPSPGAGEKLFLAVRLSGVGDSTTAAFIALNDLFDGTSETTAGDRSTKGRIRFITMGATATVFFLVSPLN